MSKNKPPKTPSEHIEPELRPRAQESLGEYVRRLRLMQGMSLPDVARALNSLPPSQRISHPYLSQIEHGQVHQPSRDRLQSLASVFNIPPEWLYEKAGLPTDSPKGMPVRQHSPLVDQLATRAALIEPADQQMMLDMVEAIIRRRESERRAKKK